MLIKRFSKVLSFLLVVIFMMTQTAFTGFTVYSGTVTAPELYIADNIVIPDTTGTGIKARVNVYGMNFDNLTSSAISTQVCIKQGDPGSSWLFGYGTTQSIFLSSDGMDTSTQWMSGEADLSGIQPGDCEIWASNTHLGADGNPDSTAVPSTLGIKTKVVRELGINVDNLNGIMTINNKDSNIQSDFENYEKIRVRMQSPSGPQNVAEYVYGDSKINVSGSAIIINDSAAQWKLDGGYSVEVLKSKTGGGRTRDALVSRGYFSLGVVVKGPSIISVTPVLWDNTVSKDIERFKFSFSSWMKSVSISGDKVMLLRRLNQGEIKDSAKKYMVFSDISGSEYEVIDTNGRLNIGTTSDSRTEVSILNKYGTYESLLSAGNSYLFIVKIGTTGVTDQSDNPIDTKSSSAVARFLDYNGETPAFMGTSFSVPPDGTGVIPPELYLADNIVVPDVIPSSFKTRINVFGKYFNNLTSSAISTGVCVKQSSPDADWSLGYGTSQPIHLMPDDKDTSTLWMDGETDFSGIRPGDCEIWASNTPLGSDGKPVGEPVWSTSGVAVKVVRELGISFDKQNGILTINNKDTSIDSDFKSFGKIKIQKNSMGVPPQDIAEYLSGDSKVTVSGSAIIINDKTLVLDNSALSYTLNVLKAKTSGDKTRDLLLNRGYILLGTVVKGPAITGVSPMLGENGVSRDVERFKVSFSSLMNSATISGDKIMLLRRLNRGETKDTSKKYMAFSDIPGDEYEVIDTSGRLNIGTTSDNRTEVSILNKYSTLASLLKPGDSYLFIVKIGTTGINDAAGNPIDTRSSSSVARFFDYNGETPAYMGTAFTVKPLSVCAYPVNSAGGANTNFIFEFQVSKQIPSGGKIKVTLPAGFIVDGAVKDKASQRNFDLNGSKGDVITISDNVAVNPQDHSVTVMLQGKTGDSTDPNNDYLSFELSGIINPSYDSSGLSNSYKAQITTLNADGSTIEGPLGTSGFNIEKSGTGSVKLTVTDGTNPVPNIRVQLQSTMTGPMNAVTDSTGIASFNSLNAGYYTMYVLKEQDVNKDSVIDYYADSNPAGINISDQAVELTMKVKSAGEYALKSVQVNAANIPTGAIIDVFASNASGYYTKRLSGGTATLLLPAGGYTIGLSPADASSAKLFVPQAPQYCQVSGDLTGNNAINIKVVSTIHKLTGRVYIITDSMKSGISGANVWAYNPSAGSTGASATTNSDGYYEMYLADGVYSVGASVPGMPPVPSLNVVLSGQDKSDVNFEIRKLDRQLTISIVDENGIIQKNIPVYASRIDKTGYINGFIDTSGSASLFVSPGTYKVGGYIPGFGSVEYGSIVDTSVSDQSIQITFLKNTTTIIKGTVRKGSMPVAGAGVWAEPTGTSYPGNSSVTDDQGNYTLRLQGSTLAPRAYTLHVYQMDVGKLDYSGTITANGTDKTGIDFAAPSTGTLTLLFTRANLPVSQLEAMVNVSNDKFRNSVYEGSTSSSGIKINLPVSSIPYNIEVFVKGYGRFTATSVITAQGTSVTFALPVPISVSGTVSNDDTGNIANAWVSIMRPNGSFSSGQKTGTDGKFSVQIPSYDGTNPDNNTYVLSVGHPNYPFKSPVKFVVTSGSAAKDFGTIKLDSGLVSVSGSVYNSDIDSYDSYVWAVTVDGKWAGTRTDTAGNFVLKLSPGAWKIKTKTEGYSASDVSVNVTGSAIALDPINLAHDDTYVQKEQQISSVNPSAGGTINDAVSGVNIIVPANALGSDSSDYTVKTRETRNVPETTTAKPAGGKGKEIKIQDSQNNQLNNLNNTIQIELSYADLLRSGSNDTLTDGTKVSSLMLGYWDDAANNWVTIPTTVDSAAKVLKGSVNHLTVFAPIIPVSSVQETVDAPTALPGTGTYTVAQNVTLSSATSSAEIYYTTDESNPSTSSTHYTGAIPVNKSTTIKAVAVKEGMSDSEVAAFSYTINISGTDTKTDDSTKVGGGGGGGGLVPTLVPTPTPVQLNKVENGKVTTTPVLDASSKQASASISSDDIKNALSNAETDENGTKVVGINVQKVDGASGYVQEIPLEELTKSENSQNLKITTELGSVTVPSNMLAETTGNGRKVSLTIAKADSSGLPSDAAAQIGTRPVVELNIKVDGTLLSWSNEEAPVAVSIPYTPSSEEKGAPEHITVLYINSSGAVSPVPSARYDSTTGQVTFKTTHFSKYAVAFVKKTFGDMAQYVWAKDAVEIMASKGVINGTSASSYTPGASVKRGDFMLLLVKVLGLSAKAEGGFADVNDGDYYAGAIAVARKLGIAKGSGDGRFNPQDSITRQDMMTLIERAMKVAGKKLSVSSGAELDAFGDREKVAAYAKDSVAALVKNGIVTGSGNNINPMGNATRAETAVLIYRIYNK